VHGFGAAIRKERDAVKGKFNVILGVGIGADIALLAGRI
jgi:hypothetical protein